mgnify:CR=1 FL=1
MEQNNEKVRQVMAHVRAIRASAVRIKQLHDEIERMKNMDYAQLSTMLRERQMEGLSDG